MVIMRSNLTMNSLFPYLIFVKFRFYCSLLLIPVNETGQEVKLELCQASLIRSSVSLTNADLPLN